MNMLEKLGLTNRRPASPPTSSEISAAIARAESEMRHNAAVLEKLADQYSALLLTADDDVLDALEIEQRAAARMIDRSEKALAVLVPQHAKALAAEKSCARRDGLAAMVVEIKPAAEALAKAISDAAAKYQAVLAIAAKAAPSGVAAELASLLEPPPYIVNLQDLAPFHAWKATTMQRATAFGTAKDRPAPQPVANTTTRPVRTATPPEPPLPPAANRHRRTKSAPGPQPGFVAVTIMRAGYEGPDGTSYDGGEIAHLPQEIANRAAMNGAVEFVKDIAA